MKKMTAFVMALALVCTNVPANLHVQTGTETVYAAQETAINSEQDLIAMQNNPKGKYYLAKDITITKKLNMFPDYKDEMVITVWTVLWERWTVRGIRSKIMRESGCLIMQKMQPLKTLS